MRNDYLYKKLKHALALNVMWNVSKYHDTRRRTMLWAFKQFQTPPTNRYMTSIEDYSYRLGTQITYQQRLICTNVYNYVLTEYNQTSGGFDCIAKNYIMAHLKLPEYYQRGYELSNLLDLIWDWMINGFSGINRNIHPLHLDTTVVINKCKEYGISLSDIIKLNDYFE